jgi:5-formyltetrahydrofolate cyclo-ligase
MTDLSADPAEPKQAQKQALRERLRFRRRHFAANLDGMGQLAAFRALPAPLADLITPYPLIGAYAAWGDEPDILPMLAEVAIALPHHADRVDTMDFRRWHAGAPLENGPWGTPQPAAPVEAALPGLILCPLVGFDRRGGRLGQGGGHYDRYFAAYPAILRIGVGWSVQEVDAVPTEPTDAALDAVLTEQEFIICGDRL